MAQLSNIKEEYSGNIIRLEKAKLSSTNTPVKYDFVAITSDGTIKKAIAQRDVDENKLVGVIVDINNSTNEVIVLTKGVFSTTYFNTINSVSISYGTKLYLSDTTSGKLILSPPTSGVRSCIALMTKRGLYVDAQAVQEVFMDQTSYDAIKGNIDAFSFINSKLLSLESTLNTFDLTPVISEINNIKDNLKNYIPILGNQSISGLKTFSNNELRIGSSTTCNFISFYGTNGDNPGGFNHTFIGERDIPEISGTSELVLYKGNDPYDKIRLIAGEIWFDTINSPLETSETFTTVAENTTKITNKLKIKTNGDVETVAKITANEIMSNTNVKAPELKTGNATIKYNEATKSLDFVFA